MSQLEFYNQQKMMKALVYTDSLLLEYRDEPKPEAQSGEVLVKVESVGICGSDMHAYQGHDERRVPPLILGHEVAGIAMNGKYKGRRVVINPLLTCATCQTCLSGRANICQQRELIGMRIPGAFAEYVVIAESNVIVVPETMPSREACLAEPTATAVHAVFLAEKALFRPISECRVLIIGGGVMGVLIALLLQNKGCRYIMLGEINNLRRQTVDNIGCAETYNPLSGPQPEPGKYDLVIDAVGSGKTRIASCNFVCAGGVISHVGLQDNAPGLNYRKLTLEEITFIGNYTYTPIDFKEAVIALSSGYLGSLDWVETRHLSAGAEAFSAIKNGDTPSPKIVLQP